MLLQEMDKVRDKNTIPADVLAATGRLGLDVSENTLAKYCGHNSVRPAEVEFSRARHLYETVPPVVARIAVATLIRGS